MEGLLQRFDAVVAEAETWDDAELKTARAFVARLLVGQAAEATVRIEQRDGASTAKARRELARLRRRMNRRYLRLAIEFSARMGREGLRSAMRWYRRARAAQRTDARLRGVPTETTPRRTDVVRSRSRRLRAPPVC